MSHPRISKCTKNQNPKIKRLIIKSKNSQKTDVQYNKMAQQLKVGDKVNVYGLIGCRNFIAVKTVKNIGPTNSSPGSIQMVWFEEGGGAWHPGAVEKVNV